MKLRRIFFGGVVLIGVVVVATMAVLILGAGRSDVGQVRRLPDGSTLRLDRVVFTKTNFMYSYQDGSKLAKLIAPILPMTLRNRLITSSGSFGFGGDGNTNLHVVTINRAPASKVGSWNSSIHRLQIMDDLGDRYDANWGANTLGMMDATVHGYVVRAFPRRSRELRLSFLSVTKDGGWTNIAEFSIPNPAFADYPQWTPGHLPTTRKDGNLAVTLKEFQSGARMKGNRGKGDELAAARKTRLVFDFAENDTPSDHWRVQKLTISDATGNRWSPYLDLLSQEFTWSTNGTVEQFGALWPGENAWKLKVEVVRTAGFDPDELWEAALDLPQAGTVSKLTNHWTYRDAGVELVALASPDTDHSGDFKWTAKYWGDEKNRVYSLAIRLKRRNTKNIWLSVVSMEDNTGAPAKLMEHRGQGDPEQGVFFKPDVGAGSVNMKFAIQRSRVVEFLARPEFVSEAGKKL